MYANQNNDPLLGEFKRGFWLGFMAALVVLGLAVSLMPRTSTVQTITNDGMVEP